MSDREMPNRLETAFVMDAASIKFGFGVTAELGFEMKRLGVKRAMVLTDQSLLETTAVTTSLQSLEEEGVIYTLYTDISIEPTDESFIDAIRFAEKYDFDGFVAVGGGSVMDTAKVVNLYDSHPADFLQYVNAPIGNGIPVPGALKPLIAVPTTAGTGSETSGVAIFDMKEMHAKTGIANRALKPNMGLVDPENTGSMPRNVAAFSAFDVLCHGLESYTALPYNQREAPSDPSYRPTYQGANPMSDVWATKAIQIVSQNVRRAVNNPEDREARANMCIAATAAGVGFGTAGVHLPHGMSYPVAGNAREFQPEGYPQERPIIPHGLSVILNAPAVFRYTASANPARHLEAARLMGADINGVDEHDAGVVLADQVIQILKDLRMPNGLASVGYDEADIDAFVAGTLPQHRVTKLAPKPTGANELRVLFEASMQLW